MATIGTRLVERLKDEALRLGTQGVRWVVESTVSAVRTVDRLQQEWIPREQRSAGAKRGPAGEDAAMEHQRRERTLYRPPPERKVVGRPAKQVRTEAQATAELVLAEARAAKERLKKAQSAPRPLKVSAEAEETPKRRTTRKTVRTQGRKTTPTAAAPKRVTAPKEGFKAKRGQKHKH
ncbi:hypothetical protein [Archangium lansingense]|uniref:Uncharacterized protein n=1 Tax=Archangium lansingense TaxID=2995310 RepID=A0ABT4AQN3_9BACT|nr:hypothetical protein [Archangium lansinium]MCY1083154.1 hypothetical protein [Archangium lansinium]